MRAKQFLLLIFLFVGATQAKETLSFNNFNGKPYLGPIRITNDQFRLYLSQNEESLRHYETGRPIYVTGSVLGAIGASFIGWNLGTTFAGGEATPSLWIVGGSSLLTGIIFNSIGTSHYRKGIAIYNSSLSSASIKPHSIAYCGNGLYATWNF